MSTTNTNSPNSAAYTKKIIISVAVIVLLLLIGWFFTHTQSDANDSGTVKIGAIISLTGDNSTQGNLAKNGILIAIDQFNKKGGINGKKISLIIEDSQTSAKGTVNAFKKLQSEKVVAMLSIGDIEFQAINSLSRNSNIPIMATICTGMIEDARSPLLFRYCFNEDLQDKILMDFAKNSLGAKTLAITFPNNAFGKTTLKYTKKRFEEIGGQIVAEVPFDFNNIDNYRSDVLKILNSKPDAVCVRGFGRTFEAIIRSLREQGYKGFILGDSAFGVPSSINNTKGSLENAYLVTVELKTNSENSFIKKYIEDYKANYKSAPSFIDALGYDAFTFLAKALEQSEHNGISISDTLYNMDSLELLLGNNFFKNSNDANFQVEIYKIVNGKVVPSHSL
ncbi:hypothetical protein CXU17_08150 [Akkermansia muciniphila]|nr:hypothetical protein CXU17_08150 [Akkermansia muciniphila]